MSSAIVMPKVGLTMTEGKIVEWKKGVGQRVEKGETVFVFETEKVSFDVEAALSGYLVKIVVGEGETVPVGAEVGFLADSPAGDAASSQPVKTAAQTAAPRAAAAVAPVERSAHQSGKVRATPLARRIARTNGLDLAQIAATSDLGAGLRQHA